MDAATLQIDLLTALAKPRTRPAVTPQSVTRHHPRLPLRVGTRASPLALQQTRSFLTILARVLTNKPPHPRIVVPSLHINQPAGTLIRNVTQSSHITLACCRHDSLLRSRSWGAVDVVLAAGGHVVVGIQLTDY